MFDQIFLSPQEKKRVIISNKQELLVVNIGVASRVAEQFKTLGNIRKISKLHRIVLSLPPKMRIL